MSSLILMATNLAGCHFTPSISDWSDSESSTCGSTDKCNTLVREEEEQAFVM